MLRSQDDRLNVITVITIVSGVAGAAAAPFLPAPASGSWPFLIFSAIAECAYCLALARAYDSGLLAEVYPIARGSSPMMVTAGAFLFAHERLTGAALAGVVLVSAGILGVALGRHRPRAAATFAALATGGFIACYTVSDGLGARASGAPAAYACWMFAAHGALMPFVFTAVRRRLPRLSFDSATFKGSIAGVLSLLAYVVVVWALSRAPMGQVSALRETGILFALVIAFVFLKERPSGRQMMAAAAIAAGAAMLA